MADVQLIGIQKFFDGHDILREVNLQVMAGEFLVMVGPSGCGKTTLLRIIAGLETADTGEIRIGGRTVNNIPPRNRDVAMVFQSYALYPHMTVRENLAFGLKLRKLPAKEIASRVAQAAALLELTALLERKPAILSGGERQRVAIGRAIVRHPRVFLFDEPLSNLDAGLRVQMRGELSRLHRRLGATMIYVTHDQIEAMTLASRVAVLHQGVLQQTGAPLELYHRPVNRFVAAFLGSPSMNFFSARHDGKRLIAKGFSLASPEDLPENAGPDVLLGLRPQNLRIANEGFLTGEVTAVERLGFDGYAYLATQAGQIIARFDKEARIAVGDKVNVSCVQDALHVFTSDGSSSLRHPSEARA